MNPERERGPGGDPVYRQLTGPSLSLGVHSGAPANVIWCRLGGPGLEWPRMRKTGRVLGRVVGAAVLLLLILGIRPEPGRAQEGSPRNNPVGINVARLSQERFVGAVGGLVNTNGGDWGYMTITWTVEDRDSSQADWILQQFLDRCFEYHLNPIIRVGTWHHTHNEIWERPDWDEPAKWRAFFERGNWGSRPVYIIVGNEPNLGFEWGGEVDAAGYAKYLANFMDVFAGSEQFKIVNAPLDASNWNEMPRMLDALEFIQAMREAVPDIFERLPAWASNPYRVPSGGDNIRFTHRAYEAELEAIGRDMPIIITESGLMEIRDENLIADYFDVAFRDWLADPKVLAATPMFWNPHSSEFWMFTPNPDGSVQLASETYRRILRLPKPAGSPNHRPVLGNVPRNSGAAAAASSGPPTDSPMPTPLPELAVAPVPTEAPHAVAAEPTSTPEPTATPRPTSTPEPTPLPTATSAPATPTPAPSPTDEAQVQSTSTQLPSPPIAVPTSTQVPTPAQVAAAAATVIIPPVPPTAVALPGANGPAAPRSNAVRFEIGNTDGLGASLRAAPDAESDKLESLQDGDVVDGFDEQVGPDRVWRRVRTAQGNIGWVVVEALVPIE